MEYVYVNFNRLIILYVFVHFFVAWPDPVWLGYKTSTNKKIEPFI